MEISIDTGNKQIKTKHFTFISGLSQYDTVPTTVALDDYMKLNGKYYVLTNQREEYIKDKSESDRYRLLSLMGIVKELDHKEQKKELKYSKDKIYCITMLCGMPPAHMEDGQLKKNYKSYFKMTDPVKVTFKGRVWNIKINKVHVYAQCYAAIMTEFQKIKDYPRVIGIDIGGFTADYMMLKRGRIDIDNTDSLENGVILLYRSVQKECVKKHDALIEESDVDEILNGNTGMYDKEIVNTVNETAAKFVERFLATFRELQIDLKNTFVVFMGGGSVLLKNFIKESPLLKNFMFIDDINANVNGYEFLYNVQKKIAQS